MTQPNAIEPIDGSEATKLAWDAARDMERRIEDALRSRHGWTDEILVIDNESEDATVEIAHRHGAAVLTTPRSVHFDADRNLAIEHTVDRDQPPATTGINRRVLGDHGQ